MQTTEAIHRARPIRAGLTSRAALAVAIFIMTLCAPAMANELAGEILGLSGKVDIVRAEQTLPATGHDRLYSGDTLVTGEGQVQIRFVDGTLLMLYRDTRFAVNDYSFGSGHGDRAQFSLLNGVMHTLTGNMDKKHYLLKTRLANLAVRGTEYSMQLDDVLRVSVDHGRVALTNAGGTRLVNAGQSLLINGPNAIPEPTLGGKINLHGARPGQGSGRGDAGGPGGHAGMGAHAGQGGAGAGAAPPPPPPPSGTSRLAK